MKHDAASEKGISRLANLRLGLIILGFITLLGGLLITAGSGYAAKESPSVEIPDAIVTVLQLQPGYEQPHSLMGLVESQRLARLGFEMGGQLNQLYIEEGERVEQGQLLAQLDTSRLEARKAELNAALSRAKADATLAQLTESRLAPLVKQKAASAQQLDEAKARLSIANAQLNEVRAALESVNVELQKSQLRAPFSGRINERMISAGAVVRAGEPIIVLSDTDSLQARFAIPENMSPQVKTGQQLTLTTPFGEIPATITHILPSRNRQTRTVDMLVTMQNATELLAGDMVTSSLATSHAARGAWVPLTALSNGLRGLWTLSVVAAEGEPVVQSRQVEVLYSDGKRAFVNGAIENGDKAIVRGTQRFVPGQSVKVRNVASGAAYE